MKIVNCTSSPHCLAEGCHCPSCHISECGLCIIGCSAYPDKCTVSVNWLSPLSLLPDLAGVRCVSSSCSDRVTQSKIFLTLKVFLDVASICCCSVASIKFSGSFCLIMKTRPLCSSYSILKLISSLVGQAVRHSVRSYSAGTKLDQRTRNGNVKAVYISLFTSTKTEITLNFNMI